MHDVPSQAFIKTQNGPDQTKINFVHASRHVIKPEIETGYEIK